MKMTTCPLNCRYLKSKEVVLAASRKKDVVYRCYGGNLYKGVRLVKYGKSAIKHPWFCKLKR